MFRQTDASEFDFDELLAFAVEASEKAIHSCGNELTLFGSRVSENILQAGGFERCYENI